MGAESYIFFISGVIITFKGITCNNNWYIKKNDVKEHRKDNCMALVKHLEIKYLSVKFSCWQSIDF